MTVNSYSQFFSFEGQHLWTFSAGFGHAVVAKGRLVNAFLDGFNTRLGHLSSSTESHAA
jgi:hypothetical protein